MVEYVEVSLDLPGLRVDGGCFLIVEVHVLPYFPDVCPELENGVVGPIPNVGLNHAEVHVLDSLCPHFLAHSVVVEPELMLFELEENAQASPLFLCKIFRQATKLIFGLLLLRLDLGEFNLALRLRPEWDDLVAFRELLGNHPGFLV